MIKVALLIDEFFGGADTAFGGYGFLARNYICKYIPDKNIHIDVLLERKAGLTTVLCEKVDNVNVYRLPEDETLAKTWLQEQNYNLFFSIEMTYPSYEIMKLVDDKKLILWIQDPRPDEQWQEKRNSVSLLKDPCVTDKKIPVLIKKLILENRIKFISQGYSLNPRAIQLYDLPEKYPIQYLPNPIDIDFNYKFDISKKKKQVIFLGRLEAQKRAWLVCEIAKLMPEYDFYIMGKFFRDEEINKKVLEPYMNGDIKNLHFTGHLEGKDKEKLIKESRLLINTSIWEGIPISWLEALQYGTLIVSCLDNENLPSKFGNYVGEILGDGYEQVSKFVPAIKELMENDLHYKQKSIAAIKYVREIHNVKAFSKNLKALLKQNIKFKLFNLLKSFYIKKCLNEPYTFIKKCEYDYKYIKRPENIKIKSQKENFANIIEINCNPENIKADIIFYGNSSNNYIKIQPSQYQIGASFRIFGNQSSVSIGNNFSSGGVIFNLVDSHCEINIGSNVMCAFGITFLPTDGHSLFNKESYELLNYNSPINIGNNVWICYSATFLKGACIPNNCVVGANAVVNKSFIEDSALIAGNPSKIIRKNIIWERKSPSQSYNIF